MFNILKESLGSHSRSLGNFRKSDSKFYHVSKEKTKKNTYQESSLSSLHPVGSILCSYLDLSDLHEVSSVSTNTFFDYSCLSKEQALMCVKNGCSLECLSPNLQCDDEIVSEALKRHGFEWQYVPEKLKYRPDIIPLAVQSNVRALHSIDMSYSDLETVFLTAIRGNPNVFFHVPEILLKEKTTCAKLIVQFFRFGGTCEDLIMFKEGVLDEKIKANMDDLCLPFKCRLGRFFNFSRLIMNSSFITSSGYDQRMYLRVLKARICHSTTHWLERLYFKWMCPIFLNFKKEVILNALTNDKDVMLTYIRFDWRALEDAHISLKADREIVMEALKQNGHAIRGASEDLKDDEHIVGEAVKKSPSALMFASPRLRNDREFLKKMVHFSWEVLDYASQQLKEDKELVKEATKLDYRAFKHASKKLRVNRGFAKELIGYDWRVLRYASHRIRGDSEIVKEAISHSIDALEWVSDELKSDKEFMFFAFKQDPEAIRYMSNSLWYQREFMRELRRLTELHASDCCATLGIS